MAMLYYLFLFFFLFVAAILCLFILIQENKSSGLGATFGGGDGGDSLFGTSTPDILKKITAWLAVGFLVGCIVLSIWTGAMGRQRVEKGINQEFVG